MSRLLCSLAALIWITTSAVAQDLLPSHHVTVYNNTDFTGSDLQQLFDTDEASCRRACSALQDCVGYTFNRKSNACFPKKSVREQIAFEGAVSVYMKRRSADARARAEQRASELDFLRSYDFTSALAFANSLPARHPGTKWTDEAMREAAAEREANGDRRNAYLWIGTTAALTDAASDWAEYARLLSLYLPVKSSDKRRFANDALMAAINGYLRAETPITRAKNLGVMADALERLGRGEATVPALKLATSLSDDPALALALSEARAKFGFRITGNEVDSSSATPRLCATFSEDLSKTERDYARYLALPDPRFAVSVEGNKLCITGAEFGSRYTVTFRAGLPAESGEGLIKNTQLSFYVRDRAPEVSFPGRGYVLPRGGEASLPVETVNIEELELTLRRVSDRNLTRAFQQSLFARPLYGYEEDLLASDIGEEVWRGTGEIDPNLNKTVTTRLPMTEALKGRDAGIYVLSARQKGETERYDLTAQQWFVLSDIGLSTAEGTDGLHVFTRSIKTAEPSPDLTIRLVSRSNRVLAEAMTDSEGTAHFPAALIAGKGGAEPAMVLATRGDDDLAFLSLQEPAFDLSDRGVSGRNAPDALDVFLATDRGIYRAGDVIHATALLRDNEAKAVEGLPLTAVLLRPDGVEYARHLSTAATAGGHVFSLPVGPTVPRGTWTLEMRADADGPALTSTSVLVEDFLPERIDFDIALTDAPLPRSGAANAVLDASYLFGAPAANLPVEARLRLTANRTLEAYPGFSFGPHDSGFRPISSVLPDTRTDDSGKASLRVKLPETSAPELPLEAQLIVQVSEGSGRPVERRETRPVASAGPLIGLKPQFEGVAAESTNAGFDILVLDAAQKPMTADATWTLNRLQTRYQWYEQGGRWNWEPIVTRRPVTQGTLRATDGRAQLELPVEWGEYELKLELDGGTYTIASETFSAGWYGGAGSTATPDRLELSLDAERYSVGDEAQLRVLPEAEGTALVQVMSSKLISSQMVTLTAGENRIPLTVTEDWGTGAYVTVTHVTPLGSGESFLPTRSIGLAHARIDPAGKLLGLSLTAPSETKPRQPLEVEIALANASEGETAYVTLAAVDAGILGVTGYEPPAPQEHYFAKRKLGLELRDIYGRLIDASKGNLGRVRSGGDAGGPDMSVSPPPTDELVSFFQGPVTIGPDGKAKVAFDIPEFNGTLRLMAVAWSPSGVGSASRDVIIRDPVVLTASLPNFLMPGDESRLRLEITHAEGPTGETRIAVSSDGIALDTSALPEALTLADGETATLDLPIRAGEVGDHPLTITLTTPAGETLDKSFTLPVRRLDPEVSQTRRLSLAAGQSLTLDANLLAAYRGQSGRVLASAGPVAKFDVASLLSELDRYPYGCTEQLTSGAMPLLYFSSISEAMGLTQSGDVAQRIERAVSRILTRQTGSGGFGMWYPRSGNLWLDAYVTDFLSRARAQGFDVPEPAFEAALANLSSRVSAAPDFDSGGGDLAYALYVLAREGQTTVSDLRYFADVKADAIGTAIGQAQLGAALAYHGDQLRADKMFTKAVATLEKASGDQPYRWRGDYGTHRRDAAAVLTLGREAGSEAVNLSKLADMIAGSATRRSTQEMVWTLLAVDSLLGNAPQVSLNGAPLDLPVLRLEASQLASGAALSNTGSTETEITLTSYGVPETPPEAGGYGYAIERSYYTLDGTRVDDMTVNAGTRLVVHLKVIPFEKAGARLMIDDPLPAGFEIDNPSLLRSGDIGALNWLRSTPTESTEFRSERFLAAVNLQEGQTVELAYIVRAISPGRYAHAAAIVEDMYRPTYRANTASGEVVILP